MSDKFTAHDIVMKIIGEIDPIGDSSVDARRFSNLQNMISLVDNLLHDIYNVSLNKDRIESSMKESGISAREALDILIEWKD